MKDSSQTIYRSILKFFSGTILSRISGMGRDIVMAAAFGTQGPVAVFMVAFRFSLLFRRLLGETAMQSAFIPQFETFRQESQEHALAFFKKIFIAFTLFLIGLICTGILLLEGLMKLEVLSADAHELLHLTVLMLPSLLFICLYGLNAAFLQCQHRFFTSGFAPTAFNLIWILSIFFIKNLEIHRAMQLLSLGIVSACFFQWAMTVPETVLLLKNSVRQIKIPLKEAFLNLLTIGKAFSIGILGIAASQINNALDSLFAISAEESGPAFLWYAFRIIQLPLSLLGVAVSGAILPPLSRAIKAQESEKFTAFLGLGLKTCLMFIIPIAFGMYACGDSAISLIYGYGDFNTHSIQGTTLCLWAYALGLIPMTLTLVLNPGFYAMGYYKIPTTASALGVVLNMCCNGLFIGVFGLGAVSIALATSLSSWWTFGFLLYNLKKMQLLPSYYMGKIFKITFASLLSFLGVFAYRGFLYFNNPATFSGKFLNFTSAASLFLGIFFTMAYFLDLEEYSIWQKKRELSKDIEPPHS